MKLTYLKCPSKCKCDVPLELSHDVNSIDILFVNNAPGKKEKEKERPLMGIGGEIIRNSIKDLSIKYDFTYGLTYVYKNTEKSKDCNLLKQEIQKYKPKIIITFGIDAYVKFHKPLFNNIMVEEGCVREVTGELYSGPLIASIHPSFCFQNDPCSAGFIYIAIEKAILFIKGVSFNIPNTFKSKTIDTVPLLRKVLKRMFKTPSYVGFDTETTSLNRVYDTQMLSLQFCNDGEKGYVLPWNHIESPFTPKELKEIKKILVQFFTDPKTKVKGYLFQNAKFDLHQLFRELHIIIYNAPIIDTMFNAFLLEENWSRVNGYFPKGQGPYSLGTLSYKKGFDKYYTDPDMSKEKRTTLKDIPLKQWEKYAAADAVVLCTIWKSQLLEAKHKGYLEGFLKMAVVYNTHLSRALTYIEHCGMPINIDTLRDLSNPRTSLLIKDIENIKTTFNTFESVKKLEKILRIETTGSDKTLFGTPILFDANKRSHKELLFNRILNLDPVNRDSANPSFDKEFQDTYKGIPEVDLLSRWGRIQKLKTSYIDNIERFMDRKEGEPDFYTDERLRSTYKHDAVTGRLRAEKPNAQQRPSHGENIDYVLSLYEATPKKLMIKLDQSTFEVRGLGILSNDRSLCKSFIDMYFLKKKWRKDPSIMSKEELKNLTDTHKRSASTFFDTPLKDVTKEQRQDAKGFVFGCFTRDTIVSTNEGPIRIGKLDKLEKDIKVLTQKGMFSSKGSEFMGIKPIVSVMTRQAHLKGTSGHWIMTVNKNCKLEMKPLGSLNIGDVVLYQRGKFGNIIPKLDRKKLSLLDIEAMGLFIADGSGNFYDKGVYRVQHCSIDKKEVNKFREFISKYCGIKAPLITYKGRPFLNQKSEPQIMYGSQINNKEIYSKLKKFGLLGNQHRRRVPSIIIQSHKEYIAAYLRGYFQGDGGIRFGKGNRAQISVTSVNPDLLFDVSYLLNLFGISSGVYKTSVAYELVITSSTSMLIFKKEIGFVTKDKKEKLLSIESNIANFSKMPIDKTNLPIDFGKLRKLYAKRAGVVTFRSRAVYYKGIHIPPLSGAAFELLPVIKDYEKAFTILGLEEEYETLLLLSREDIKVSKVFQGPITFGKKKVYDVVNVKKVHTWSANGICVHNTMYGMGDNSIANNLGKTLKQAQAIKELFFKNMPDAANWLFKTVIKFSRRHLFVESPLGRRRRLWGYLLPKGIAWNKMDRLAMNSPIQGVCSDLNIIATSLLIEKIYKKGIGKYQVPDSKAFMIINLVHDSCEMETTKIIFKVISIIEDIFTKGLVDYVKEAFDFDIRVPLEVDIEIGKRFSEMNKWDGSEQSLEEIKAKLS